MTKPERRGTVAVQRRMPKFIHHDLDVEMRSGPTDRRRTVDLRDMGFEGRVSDEALAEIDAAERRRARAFR